MGKVGSIEEAVYACKLRRGVILSEAKLQRSGQGPRGQAFNLRHFWIGLPQQKSEMFESLASCFVLVAALRST